MTRQTPMEFHLRELMMLAREPAIDAEPRVQKFLADYGAIPLTLSGCKVIAAVPRLPRVASDPTLAMIVLVEREHPLHPYVTGYWEPRFGDSWDSGGYCETLAEGLVSLVERARITDLVQLTKPHDEGAAPPLGFTRYQIEITVPEDEDPSALLERAQALAADILDEHDIAYDDDTIGRPIVNATSVQAMKG